MWVARREQFLVTYLYDSYKASLGFHFGEAAESGEEVYALGPALDGPGVREPALRSPAGL